MFQKSIFMFLIVFCLSISGIAQEWLVYDGSVLPDQSDPAFEISTNTYGEFGADSTSTVINDPLMPGNSLLQFITAVGDGRFLWRIQDMGLNPANGATFMFRVKPIDFDTYDRTFELDIRAGNVREKVVLRGDDRIQLERADQNATGLPGMQNWHTYRVTYFDSETNVYIDEDPTPVVTGVTPDSVTDDYFRFGDGSGSSSYGGLIDWFMWDTSGTYAPGEGAAIPEGIYVDPTPAQVAHWALDETSGTLVEDAVGDNDGTLVYPEGTEWVEAVDGNGLDFSGATDSAHIIVPHSSDIEFSTGAFSVSYLIKTDLSQNCNAFYKGTFDFASESTDSTATWFQSEIKGGQIRFAIDDNGNQNIVKFSDTDSTGKTQVGYNLPYYLSNTWIHFVGVRNTDEDSVIVYINGERVAAGWDKTAGPIGTAHDLFIGNNYKESNRVDGILDDLQFLNYALTDDDVADMFANYAIKPPGKIAHWSLDETSGTAVADVFGDNDGTLVNPDGAEWVEAVVNNGLDFSGATDSAHIIVPHSSDIEFSTGAFSVSYLIKTDLSQNCNAFYKGTFDFARESADSNATWLQSEIKGGQIRFAIDDNGNQDTVKFSDTDSTGKTQVGYNLPQNLSNTWIHFVGVRNTVEDSVIVYINGERVAAGWDKTAGPIGTAHDLFIGNNYKESNKVDGLMDELQFFDYALTDAAVATMFDEYAIDVPAVVAHWKLDETTGTTAADYVGGSDGTLVNMAGTEWVAGASGNGLDFSAAPDSAHIVVPHSSVIEFSTGAFSVSYLIKTDISQNCNAFYKGTFDFARESADSNATWLQSEIKGGQIRFAIDDNGNQDTVKFSDTDSTGKTQVGYNLPEDLADDWIHFVGVRNTAEDSLIVYINGERVAAGWDKTAGPIGTDHDLFIGNNYKESNRVDGILDDLQFLNYALSDAEVKAMWDAYDITLGMEEEQGALPLSYSLRQNYPNPFNPSTFIEFSLVEPGLTQLTVYNTIGQKVATIVNQELKAGKYKVPFVAGKLASGVYFYRISSKSFTKVKKMVLIK